MVNKALPLRLNTILTGTCSVTSKLALT
uniref:Uncharacterized protein n=1 Tax=Anguilla anguilla TaxID=7936 RepID=A0A0E9TAC7_ANGAN